MDRILRPMVAGMFYPENAETLKSMVDELLHQNQASPAITPKALIVPHAGYIYSGSVAASAYGQVLPVREQIKQVVLLAPAHRVGFRGIATTSADKLSTPLGAISVDHEARNKALTLPQVQIFDMAFEGEHALEVQLPFLQRLLPDFKVVPFIVGQSTPQEVSELLELLWGNQRTLIVISSDLSHFLDYHSARERDARTTQAIVNLQADSIGAEDACGHLPIQGFLKSATDHHLHATAVDVRNSGDTAGDKRRVVGYGAYAFYY